MFRHALNGSLVLLVGLSVILTAPHAAAQATSRLIHYSGQGFIAEIGSDHDYPSFTNGLSVGNAAILTFSLYPAAFSESSPGVYEGPVYSFGLVSDPQAFSGGGGSAYESGSSFELESFMSFVVFPDGELNVGLHFKYSAIGLAPGAGLRLPSDTAVWEALITDSNGHLLLRAVPEPATSLLLCLTVAGLVLKAGRRMANIGESEVSLQSTEARRLRRGTERQR